MESNSWVDYKGKNTDEIISFIIFTGAFIGNMWYNGIRKEFYKNSKCLCRQNVKRGRFDEKNITRSSVSI